VPDLDHGAALATFVTLRRKSRLAPPEIFADCAARPALTKRPKSVVRERLPVNPQGKVMKTELWKLALSEAVWA
jgi:hypothetical protein